MNSGRVDVHSKNLTLNTTSSVALATKTNNSGKYQFSDDGSDHFTASGLAISGDGIFATVPHTNLTINVNSLTDKVVKRDEPSSGWKAGKVNVLYDRESSSTQEGLVTEENYKDYIIERSRDMPTMETMNTEGIGLSIISRNSSAGGYAYLNGNTSINVNGTGASTGILVDGYYEAPQVASISNAIIDTKHLPVIQKPALTLSGNTTINVESTHDRAIGILALGTNSKYMEIPGDTHIEEEWDYKEEFVQINQFAHDVLSKGNLTIQAKGINGSDSYGIYVQSGARVDLLGKTTIDAPQAFGGGGVIFAYGDVILKGDTRIDGMLKEVYRNGVDVENNQNYKANREAGAFIQYGGTLNIQSEKNGWFSGELNISAPHARINVDRLTLDENQNSGKVQIDYGGTLFVSDYFSSQGRNNLNISDNGRLIVTEKALLQNASGEKPLVQSENWNRIDRLSIKESGIIQIIYVSKAEYTREDLDVIRKNLFQGNEKKGIIE
ncbi:MAG: hypothetical protein IJ022_03215, partial [Burkholderiaceae bacterium]|nr:hypothetical protein [Burkholderiaceae bacterium]